MTSDRSKLSDSVSAVLGSLTRKPKYVGRITSRLSDRGERKLLSTFHIVGFVEARLFGPDGKLKQLEQGYNLVTDYGDEHVGERMALDSQDIVTGMRLGDQSTPAAASKAGAGAALQSYITGSQEALDASAIGSDKGAGLGWRQAHVSTWIAGDVTNAAITEVVLTDETALTDTSGVVGDTVARFIFGSPIDKQSGDSLEVTWNIDFLGA